MFEGAHMVGTARSFWTAWWSYSTPSVTWWELSPGRTSSLPLGHKLSPSSSFPRPLTSCSLWWASRL